MSGWTLLGAPIDSAGRGEGEQRAPQSLRATGLAGRVGAIDAGDFCRPLTDSRRDPDSGVIGYAQVREASGSMAEAGAEWITAMLERAIA